MAVVAHRLGSGTRADGVEHAEFAGFALRIGHWFVLRNVHQNPSMTLLQSRTTLAWLRGPMTRQDLKRLVPHG